MSETSLLVRIYRAFPGWTRKAPPGITYTGTEAGMTQPDDEELRAVAESYGIPQEHVTRGPDGELRVAAKGVPGTPTLRVIDNRDKAQPETPPPAKVATLEEFERHMAYIVDLEHASSPDQETGKDLIDMYAAALARIEELEKAEDDRIDAQLWSHDTSMRIDNE